MQNSKRNSWRARRCADAATVDPRLVRCISEALESRTLLSAELSQGTGTALSPLTSNQLTNLLRHDFATPTLDLATPDVGSASPAGLTPTQIRGAYGVSSISGDGTGQTIAIIDAYDDPNALSDLQHFDSQFGLPDPPSFQKLNQEGNTSPLPGTDPSGPYYLSGVLPWEAEESLDIEYAHAMAPGANIDLIECNSSSFSDLLFGGAETAAKLPGVSVASMSFGGGELAEQNGIDSVFFTPSGHNGVTFFASTGDDGSPSGYPAYSQAVVAVGGTSLTVSGNSYVSETGWSGSGGGIATQELQPSFQTPYYTSTQRTAPDVAADADPATGVPIYDSYDLPAATPWIKIGGTSLASPLWAGMMAVVQQTRVNNSLGTLDTSQALPLLYNLPATDFHDIISGSNGGFSAGSGYDLVTGRGSPIANLLIPALGSATAPTVLPDLQPFRAFDPSSGNLWSAPIVLSTASGVHTDPSMITPGNSLYLNASWVNDAETATTANFPTDFILSGTNLGNVTTNGGISGGNFVPFTDYLVTTFPSGITSISMSVDSNNTISESTETNNSYTRAYGIDANTGDNYVIQLDPTGTNVQVLLNNALQYSVAKTSLNQFNFYLSGNNDTVTVNVANGNPIPIQGGLVVNGTAGDSDTLSVTGSSGNDNIQMNTSSITINGAYVSFANMASLTVNSAGGTDTLSLFGDNSGDTISVSANQAILSGLPINFSNLENLVIDTGTGNDVLTQSATPSAALSFSLGSGNDIFNLNGGSITFASDVSPGTSSLNMNVATSATATFNSTQHLAALNLTGGSANLSANGSRVLVVGTISNIGAGSLDLTDNNLIATGTTQATITSLIQGGFNSGTWTGAGIRSSTAAAHSNQTIGFGPASTLFTSFPATFAGQTVSSGTAILARYTILGDANLDRTVNTADFSLLAAHYGSSNLPFTQGNFNFDTPVNALDFNALATNYGLPSTGAAIPDSGAPIPSLAAPPTPNLFSSIAIHDAEPLFTLLG